MKRIFALIIVVVLAALVMILTVPSKESFFDHLENEVIESSEDWLDRLGGEAALLVAKQNTIYKRRLVFASVQIKDGSDGHCYMGLFGTWFPVSCASPT